LLGVKKLSGLIKRGRNRRGFLSEESENAFIKVKSVLRDQISIMDQNPYRIFTLGCKGLLETNTLAYGYKKFYNIEPWGQCYKTFYSLKLQISVVS
jgi:hypothetical protein